MVRKIFLAVSIAVAMGLLASTQVALAQKAEAATERRKQEAAEKERSGKPQLSRAVHKPLKAAQEAMQKEDWDTALAKVNEARAIPERTAFDDFQINEFLGFLAFKRQDYATAAKAFEEQLNSGFLDEELVSERVRQVTQLYFQIEDYAKAAEYAQRWVDHTNGSDVDALVFLGQAQYLLDDTDGTLKSMGTAIDATEKAGQAPKEQWLQIMLSVYDRKEDAAGVSATLQDLVKYYPSRKYWDQVLTTLQTASETDDRTMLNIYRLMFETGVMEQPEEYVELAELALEAGLPGETVTVLESGFAAKVLEGEGQERRRSRLAEARKQADGDRKALPSLEKEAMNAKVGEPDVALGIAYFSYGQFDKAAEALKRGVAKGSVKRPDEAQVMLGRALLKLNQKEEARKAFAAVPETSKLARVAQLWAIYAGQQA